MRPITSENRVGDGSSTKTKPSHVLPMKVEAYLDEG